MKITLWPAMLIALGASAPAFAFLNFGPKPPPEEKALGDTAIKADATIAENLGNARQFSTLVDSLKAADLLDTLKGPGPYTVFAPTNAGFDRLPTGALSDLMKPEQKETLARIMKYQIVEGIYDASAMTKLMRQNRAGRAEITTTEGHKLIVTVSSGGHDLEVTDDKGFTAKIQTVDVKMGNGVIQVTDRVMQP